MVSKYTIAAVPADAQSNRRAKPAVPLPVKIPYTLGDAVEIAKKYNANPIYRGILSRYRYSHFVAMNLEALTMDPPPYHIAAMGTVIKDGDGTEIWFDDDA